MLFTTLVFFATAQLDANPVSLVSPILQAAEEKTFYLTISGMTCDKCSQAVQSALSEITGVSSVTISMPDRATVVANSEVSAEDLIKAVQTAGYEASES